MSYLKRIVLLGLWLATVGCSLTGQSATLDSASTEWRLKSLEESFLNFREEQRKQVDKQEADNNELRVKMASFEAELLSLKGSGTQGDALTDKSKNPSQPDESWGTDLASEEQGKEKNVEPKTAESNEEKPWNIAPQNTMPVSQSSSMDHDKTKHSDVPKIESSKRLYDASLAKYNAEDFAEARQGFDTFLKEYPKNELVPNALYWKGETYYSEKDYAQAILTFKEVTGQFPTHAKSAAALLKIGMSYDRVGDPDNATFYLKALLDDFPKSDPAQKARKELDRLGR